MSDLTLNVLFEAYLESLEEIEPERLSTRRSHLRNIGKHLDLLTFTPSVDTAERDLPMHGGSNP
jgi:hypothetical protein